MKILLLVILSCSIFFGVEAAVDSDFTEFIAWVGLCIINMNRITKLDK